MYNYNIKLTQWLFFSKEICLDSLKYQWSVPLSEICLWFAFFALFIWEMVVKTLEASDFWWLHKIKNCEFH